MKAIEFVKEHGLEEAIKIVKASQYVGIDKSVVDIEEVKRLIKQHTLVDEHGGLEKVKQDILIPCCFGDNDFFQEVTLKKAVKDVEVVIND